MQLRDLEQELVETKKVYWKVLWKAAVCLLLLGTLSQLLSSQLAPVYAQPSSLLVFAEASSFARLDDIDPSGWFYQAGLFNPTDSDMAVTGLRWWYNASTKIVDGSRDARCFDARYFSSLPSTYVPNDRTIRWEYAAGTISLTIPPRQMVVPWIEVPPDSVNNDAISATYYVQAYVDGPWVSSPLYVSHSGHDKIVSTVFRADFDLATDPNSEDHTHPNPEWLFNEDRSVTANLSTRVRVIPITSSRNTNGMDYATVNVTLPAGWGYVSGSASNPHNETITATSVGGKDRLQWELRQDVLRYSITQSMAQNYVEFNVTAPHLPGIHTFTVTSAVTSLAELRTTIENQSIHVVVKTPPHATFTSSPTTPLTNEDVTFNASASLDLDGRIGSYLWDFADGNTATGNVTTHSFVDNGTYVVTLTIIDNDGLNDTALDTIAVLNRPPVATFIESAETADTGVFIFFNASASHDLDGAIVSYVWDFDDGTNATGVTAAHSYADDGTYVVTLTVTDDDGAAASTNATKTITNRSPIAAFTESRDTVYTGETITFNATNSYDSDGAIIEYFWDFGDNTNATGVSVAHSYADNGTYTITLTVTDDDGASAIATDIKTILNRAPLASFEIDPQQPRTNELIIFNASDSYDLDGRILTYTWNFGDDNITAGTSPTLTHTYKTSGDYSVVLSVTDNDHFSNSSTRTFTVQNVDVALLDITVSAEEVYVGQALNISVAVRNEGAVNETFNVTLYYDGTVIETQIVTDLAPGAERTLTFRWNTTGVTPDVSYTLRAVTSGVAGDTDTADNVQTSDSVNVKSQVALEPFDWNLILPYLIPIVVGIVGFSVVGMLRKQQERGQGFEFFDEMTGGGIPDAYSVMVIGGASSGKSVLCQQLAYSYLTQGKSCVYVTYDSFPFEVRRNMENFQWGVSRYEQEGTFKFVDAYSATAGLNSEEEHCVEQPFALPDLGITLSTAMNTVKQKPTRVFLDSTASLFARVDPTKVIEFIQDRSAKVKGDNGVFCFTVGQGIVPSDLMRRLEEIVDCIIELDVPDAKGKTWKRLRIRKLRGRKATNVWISFNIESRKGIIFLLPKGWSKSKEARGSNGVSS